MQYEGLKRRAIRKGQRNGIGRSLSRQGAAAVWARLGARRAGREMQAVGGAGRVGVVGQTLVGCAVGDGGDLCLLDWYARMSLWWLHRCEGAILTDIRGR